MNEHFSNAWEMKNEFQRTNSSEKFPIVFILLV